MEQRITTIITDLLEKMQIPVGGVVCEEIAGQHVFCITSERSRDLIGPRGDTLRSIETIVKKIAEHQGVEMPHFVVDVDRYRVRQIESIQQKARMMAERARSFEYDVELAPMSAYERLIVHAALAEEENISTESHGEGRNRRVVIRYSARSRTPQNEMQESEL